MAIQDDDYDAWFNQGTELYHLGQCEEAITCWEKASQIQSDYYQAWGCRGDALSDIGCYEEAISSYNQALTIQPDYYEAWYGLGFINCGLISGFSWKISKKP